MPQRLLTRRRAYLRKYYAPRGAARALKGARPRAGELGSNGRPNGSHSPAALVAAAVREGLRKLWEEEREAHPQRSGVFYPSYIAHCLRKQYYTYTLGEEPTPETLAVFATGRGVHDAVAEALGAAASVRVASTEQEVTLNLDGVALSGRADVVLAEVGGRRVVVEVKSASRLPDSPYPHHVFQLQIYLSALGVEDGVLLYWDKRTGRLAAFDVRRDPSYVGRAAERVRALMQHLASGAPPPREALLTGGLWECAHCPYRRECRPGLLPGIPEGSAVAVAEVDGALVDDSERRRAALAAAGVPGDAPPWRLTGEARERFLEAYYAEEALRLDGPGPLLARALRRPGGVRLVVVTSRPERLRAATEAELRGLGVAPDAFVMAPPGAEDDWRQRMLELLAEEYGIALVLDPDPWVRRAAERLGAEAPRPRGRAVILAQVLPARAF